MSTFLWIRVLGTLTMLGFGIGEYILLKRRGRNPDMAEFRLTLHIAAYLVVFMYLRELYFVPLITNFKQAYIPNSWQLGWPIDWRSFLVGTLIFDFMSYWMHRGGHTVRWLWAGHQTHHSPRSMFLGVGQRISFFETYMYVLLLDIPLSFIFPTELVDLVAFVNLVYQFSIHTEFTKDFGLLSKIFNTPSHHRVHHAIDDGYLNKNFGGIFIIWDKIFGTFQAEGDAQLTYGLKGVHHQQTAREILFRPYLVMAKGLWHKLKSPQSEGFHYSLDILPDLTLRHASGSVSLLTLLQSHDIQVASSCGGQGICGQCRINCSSGQLSEPTPYERELLSAAEQDAGIRLACQSKLRGDAAVRVEKRQNQVAHYPAEIVASRLLSPTIREITIQVSKDFHLDLAPGCFLEFRIPAFDAVDSIAMIVNGEEKSFSGTQIFAHNDKAVWRAYSLASSPNEIHSTEGRYTLSFHVRLASRQDNGVTRLGRGSSYLWSLSPGAQLDIRGPFGDFRLPAPHDLSQNQEEGSRRKHIFVAGGAGLAPLRAMAKAMLEVEAYQHLAEDEIHLIYGGKTPQDLYHITEGEQWSQQYKRYSQAFAVEHGDNDLGPSIVTGKVTQALEPLLRDSSGDEADRFYYVCGPKAMIDSVVQTLRDFDVSPQRIFIDSFGA